MSIVSTRYGRMHIIDTDSTVSRSLALYGEWAQHEIDIFAQFILPGSCILDAGAFIGTHTLAFSNLTGPAGRVYSFEPRKEIFAILLENLGLNTCSNVTALNMALGKKERALDLYPLNIDIPSNFGSLSLDNHVSLQLPDMYQIKMSTVDSLGIDKVDVFKLDAEGMEGEILEGARQTIARDRPVIFCECNSLTKGNELFQLGQSAGYCVYGFLASAYNAKNYNKRKENIFHAAKELTLILIPKEKTAMVTAKTSAADFLPINDIEDLVLPLLHKPQYAHEVLAYTSGGTRLGLAYPSGDSSKHDDQIADLNRRLFDSERTLEGMRKSRSWRITQIARFWSQKIRQIKQQ